MSELLGSKPLMESSAAEPSAASVLSSNAVLDSEAMRRGGGRAVVPTDIDTVDGEPIDFSKHTYGGRGTLHDGERVLYDPRGRAEACTFATMQRRAEEQRLWMPGSDAVGTRENLSSQREKCETASTCASKRPQLAVVVLPGSLNPVHKDHVRCLWRAKRFVSP